MSGLQTKRLQLEPRTPEHVRALLAGADAYEKKFGQKVADGLADFMKAASPEWIARVQAATSYDLWNDGFSVMHAEDNMMIGAAGYKGPPVDGMVEIAYGIAPAYQGQGYATEAAQALVDYAIKSGQVSMLRAHTLPEVNASGGVLRKCGFKHVGEVIDPEDGLVWRWERLAAG
jgi:ribosomal-protein-alanine N-acetyltransferase